MTILSTISPSSPSISLAIDYPYFCPAGLSNFNEVAEYFFFFLLVRVRIPSEKEEGIRVEFLNGSSSRTRGKERDALGGKKEKKEKENNNNNPWIGGRRGISWLTVGQISSGLIEDGLAKRVVSAVSGERWLDYLRRTRFPFEYPWINYRPSLSDRFVSTGGEKGVCLFAFINYLCALRPWSASPSRFLLKYISTYLTRNLNSDATF